LHYSKDLIQSDSFLITSRVIIYRSYRLLEKRIPEGKIELLASSIFLKEVIRYLQNQHFSIDLGRYIKICFHWPRSSLSFIIDWSTPASTHQNASIEPVPNLWTEILPITSSLILLVSLEVCLAIWPWMKFEHYLAASSPIMEFWTRFILHLHHIGVPHHSLICQRHDPLRKLGIFSSCQIIRKGLWSYGFFLDFGMKTLHNPSSVSELSYRCILIHAFQPHDSSRISSNTVVFRLGCCSESQRSMYTQRDSTVYNSVGVIRRLLYSTIW